ncbi:MAG: alpha/beta hydrolase fold domain-containing protein [Angelakisella sp.]|nr:alpha/beta hydrolase fold domain-containing protein [Angelakisella sp.]
MGLPAKLVRSQLHFFKPFVAGCSLETTRRAQDKLGELMEAIHKKDVIVRDYRFARFEGAWIIPRDERREGVILYLHGGGYTCGSLEYAKGFGATLADECGVRVFCAAYRLAPENPFPAALEDALESYRYLLGKGYLPGQIVLCGESAGGGLIYALCLRLRELGMTMPGGLIAISPWTDLTCSGESFITNRENDPSLTAELLRFYAGCYTAGGHSEKEPMISPLYGDLTGLPPSLLFAGGDELLLDDARRLHQKLQQCGCRSRMIIAPERWHAYVLYYLNENMSDFEEMDQFLSRVMGGERKLRWMRLDNAAKIYPAARRRNWNNLFRLSATLTEPVDVPLLQTALDVTVRRFPSIAVRLRRGAFWYYLEQIPAAPPVLPEKSYPLVHMPFDDIRRCAFRVLVYRDRVAVEFFHALTDGTGGMIFLKTLLAEYLCRKTGVEIPPTDGVLRRLDPPREEELEDSFLRYAGQVPASRREATAYHLSGTPEPDGFLHLTTLMVPAAAMKETAKRHGVTVTELLCAAMMKAILNLQEEKVPNRRHRRPVKVLVPVNLRGIFPSSTLRNFAQYVTPEADPKMGDFTLEELCRLVHHRMGLEVGPKQMSARIATNVNSERSPVLKVMPLFIKNIAMKAVFDAVGECKACLCLSNLGVVQLPQEMRPFIRRMDFIIGVQARAPHNCGVITYGDTVYINMIRNIREPELERHFYEVLHRLGLPVRAESNQP